MIVIRVALTFNPSERTTMLTYMQTHLKESRAFTGCLNYGLYQDIADENRFLLYEEWDTQANFDAYKASEAFKTSGEVLFPLMVGTPDSVYYSASVLQ
jgi:quinol monooxygenase YgiN